jgi:hypothetical protein
MHELGHQMGLGDNNYGGLMNGILDTNPNNQNTKLGPSDKQELWRNLEQGKYSTSNTYIENNKEDSRSKQKQFIKETGITQ